MRVTERRGWVCATRGRAEEEKRKEKEGAGEVGWRSREKSMEED